jgi:hypothetical protein
MAITKMQSPTSFKIAVTSQHCFTLSRLSHRCPSQILDHLPTSMSKEPFPTSLSFHNPTPSLAEQVSPRKSQRSFAPSTPLHPRHLCPSSSLHPRHLCTLNISAILFFSRHLVLALLSSSRSSRPPAPLVLRPLFLL